MSSEELGEDASAEHLENAQDTIDDAKAAAARAGNLIEDHDGDEEDGSEQDGAKQGDSDDELEVERDENPEEPAESEGP